MIGEKLGPYTIQEIVGNGSLGTVYRAEDANGRPVALKLVRSEILNTRERREQFLRLALTASEIRDPGVCPILEIGDDNDDFFVIMPFINGKTLDKRMEKSTLPWSNALDIALATGSAIQAIHTAGAVHQGLKPSNIWILDGREQRVMLSDCCMRGFTQTRRQQGIDFSNLKSYSANAARSDGMHAYMSPEQVRGESVDHRTDIFSYGVILYEMFGGRHPFKAKDLPSCIQAILKVNQPEISGIFSPIFMKMEPILHRALAKNPVERFPSVKEMIEEIKAARESSPELPFRAQMPLGIREWILTKFRRCLGK